MIPLSVAWEVLKQKSTCPMATRDLKINTKNRNDAIKAEHIRYGPLN